MSNFVTIFNSNNSTNHNFMETNTMSNRNTNRYNDDLIDNPSTRCPVALVLDTSGSMEGDPINELNAGIQSFLQEVKNDDLACYSVEIAVFVADGHGGRCLQDFTCAENIDDFSTMSAYGGTPLGQAVNEALNKLENRKSQYKKTGTPYYQPWLVIISDGYPNDYDWEQTADKAKNLASQRKLVSLPIGVKGADLSALQRFSNKPAVALQGLKFREFFSWLSASMSRVSASTSTEAAVNLPAMNSWASI